MTDESNGGFPDDRFRGSLGLSSTKLGVLKEGGFA